VITLLTGSNDYEIEHELRVLISGFSGEAEVVDGSELSSGRLIDLVSGATLFSDKRMVVIRSLSGNTSVWPTFSAMSERVSDDVQLILVEPKLDKRTATYKLLKKSADVREFSQWAERDTAKAESWLGAETKKRGIALDTKSLRHLVNRVGASQWRLAQALDKLSLLDDITPARIDDIVEQTPSESVWELFDAALRGNNQKVMTMLETLRLTEDPYMLFGLLSGQVYQLATLSVATAPIETVSKDLGLKSSYSLTKLAQPAQKLSSSHIRNIVASFAEADLAMKTSGGEPWLLLERALLKTAQIVK